MQAARAYMTCNYNDVAGTWMFPVAWTQRAVGCWDQKRKAAPQKDRAHAMPSNRQRASSVLTMMISLSFRTGSTRSPLALTCLDAPYLLMYALLRLNKRKRSSAQRDNATLKRDLAEFLCNQQRKRGDADLRCISRCAANVSNHSKRHVCHSSLTPEPNRRDIKTEVSDKNGRTRSQTSIGCCVHVPWRNQ